MRAQSTFQMATDTARHFPSPRPQLPAIPGWCVPVSRPEPDQRSRRRLGARRDAQRRRRHLPAKCQRRSSRKQCKQQFALHKVRGQHVYQQRQRQFEFPTVVQRVRQHRHAAIRRQFSSPDAIGTSQTPFSSRNISCDRLLFYCRLPSVDRGFGRNQFAAAWR